MLLKKTLVKYVWEYAQPFTNLTYGHIPLKKQKKNQNTKKVIKKFYSSDL